MTVQNEKIEQQKIVMQRLQRSFQYQWIGHAYLFEGDRGTGKEAMAYYFAKLLLCQSPRQSLPCEQCHSCHRVNARTHPNIQLIRPDGQEIKKEQITSLLSTMTKKAFEPGRKLYIIAQAERMNVAAANTLLKYLEEPDGEVTAILLTEAPQLILPTIRSRCQNISFLPPSRDHLMAQLVSQGVTQSMAASVTAVTSNYEEAFALAHDEQFAHLRKTVLKLVETINRHVNDALLYIQTDWSVTIKEKDEIDWGLNLLLYAYRDIVSLKAGLESTLTFPDHHQLFQQLSVKLTYKQLSYHMELILQAKKKLNGHMNRMLLMEQLVLNMQEGLMLV